MSKLACSLIALSLMVLNPVPAFAIDWIGNRVNSNLENNLRRHQQEGARQQRPRPRAEQPRPRSSRQGNRTMSRQAEAQARAEGQRIMESHRPRLEREHRRRVARDGKASADRWAKAEAFAIGERVGRQMEAKYAGR